ncbi:MAG TPA: enoyl-CoA hydratase-related protein [Acidimicrobiia bacterium]
MTDESDTSDTAYDTIVVDRPAEHVGRITLNRPEKRNAINGALRIELFDALHAHDDDADVRVTIVRGAGPCFSSGYDLGSPLWDDKPFWSADGDGKWARHVSDGWFGIWDLAKPVIAQVHGYALAGGTELIAACDLAYCASDAQIGYPVTRIISPPDMQFHPYFVGLRHAMELLLTGDSVTGDEAARMGIVNRAYPADELEAAVLDIAGRVARTESDLQQINKRSVHRAMDIMGIRAAIRAGSELQALAGHQRSVRKRLADALGAMKGAVDKPKP